MEMALPAAPHVDGDGHIKIPNVPHLYRHVSTGRYYARKKFQGRQILRSLGTTDRKIADRVLRDWLREFDAINHEVGRMTLRALIDKFTQVTKGKSKSTQVSTRGVCQKFMKWCVPSHGMRLDMEVRKVQTSQLDAWLATQEPRLKPASYNRYAGFVKQLFELPGALHRCAARGTRGLYRNPAAGVDLRSAAGHSVLLAAD